MSLQMSQPLLWGNQQAVMLISSAGDSQWHCFLNVCHESWSTIRNCQFRHERSHGQNGRNAMKVFHSIQVRTRRPQPMARSRNPCSLPRPWRPLRQPRWFSHFYWILQYFIVVYRQWFACIPDTNVYLFMKYVTKYVYLKSRFFLNRHRWPSKK